MQFSAFLPSVVGGWMLSSLTVSSHLTSLAFQGEDAICLVEASSLHSGRHQLLVSGILLGPQD